MIKSKKLISLTLITSFLFTLSGCGSITTTPPAATPVKEAPVALTVSAAASLKDAMNGIKDLYAKDKSNVTLTFNFGGSGALETQIEQGAPADIFISAANKQMDALKAKQLIDETTLTSFLGNTLVLVVPTSSGISSVTGLTDDKVKKIAIGEPKSVPCGQYALEAFKNLKIDAKLQPKEVQGQDVKQVLTWVETGDAEAGFVYSTDAKTSTKVKVAETLAESSHSPIVYPMAVIKSSTQADAAKAFIKFLSGDKAKKVFQDLGFIITTK